LLFFEVISKFYFHPYRGEKASVEAELEALKAFIHRSCSPRTAASRRVVGARTFAIGTGDQNGNTTEPAENEEEEVEKGEEATKDKENKAPNHGDAERGVYDRIQAIQATAEADMIEAGHLSPIARLVAMVGGM
jgi:hypothetical protein